MCSVNIPYSYFDTGAMVFRASTVTSIGLCTACCASAADAMERRMMDTAPALISGVSCICRQLEINVETRNKSLREAVAECQPSCHKCSSDDQRCFARREAVHKETVNCAGFALQRISDPDYSVRG